MDSNKIKKIIKPNRKRRLICLISLIVAIVFICVGAYIDRDRSLTPKDYHELIANNLDKENEYVKLNITSLFSFAKKGDSLYYYFVSDEDNYLYIARITEETYKKLEDLYKQDNENFSYELKGYIFKIPDDIKELAISSYNKEYNENILNSANLNDYVGECYLDETLTPYTTVSAIFVGVGVGLIIFSLVLFIINLVNTINSKVRMRKYDINEIKSELAKETTLEYPNIYLTDKYIISNLNGLLVFNYDDFVWLYNEKRRINGIYVGTYLKGITTKKKVYYLGYTKNKEEFFEEVMNKAYQKNNNLLIGFTGENQKKYKEYFKK